MTSCRLSYQYETLLVYLKIYIKLDQFASLWPCKYLYTWMQSVNHLFIYDKLGWVNEVLFKRSGYDIFLRPGNILVALLWTGLILNRPIPVSVSDILFLVV